MSILNDVIKAVLKSGLGGYPTGDPGLINAYAQRLLEEASVIGQRAQAVTATVDAARYESPSATRLRNGAASQREALLKVVASLQHLATDLQNAAASLEKAQAEWSGGLAHLCRDLNVDVRLVETGARAALGRVY